VASAESIEAIAVWNMLQTGMGGIDWQGLPTAVEFFGIENVEALIDGLLTIKGHKPPKEDGK
jgi:hypothetical protein